MKRLAVALFVVCVSHFTVMAQSACEINDVHTNPDPQYVKPAAASAAEPYHTNQFGTRGYLILYNKHTSTLRVPAGAYVVIATSGGRSATFKILYAP
jgi:hypothetical protein